MNLKFCLDKNLQDCLIWQHNRDFYIYSNDTETNNFQNFKQFLENMCVLISSNTHEMKVEKVDLKNSQEFLLLLGDISNVDEYLEDQFNSLHKKEENIYKEVKKQEPTKELSLLNKNSSKSTSFVNFKKTYTNTKVIFSAKVQI